ncbi:MAG: branched-chain amino acid ABC transporter permease [Pseudomonadota bacterium]|nr:branched-chain amino acid ABC transporter permease [Pseudomonadota bacterium]
MTASVTPPAALASARSAWVREYSVWLIAIGLLLVLPHIPGLNSNFGRSLLSQMGIATVFALSYNLLLGQTGLLSFGHAVYFGLGGFAAIHVMRAINAGLGIPMPLVPLAGAASGLFFGMLFGSFTTRRAGVVFALISLGVGELVFAASGMLQRFSGGEGGLTANRAAGPPVFGLDFASQLQVYYIIAFWAVAAAWLMYAFTRTPVGRMCNAIRDNPERAAFVGYDPQRVRFIVFAVAAMFAGLAGGLHAVNYEIVAVDAVGTARSSIVLLMVYIGGEAYFVGAILGAIAITWLQVSLSDYTTAWQLYLGLFFMAIVLFAPGGLAGLIMMHGPIVRTRAFASVIRSYGLAAVAALVMLLGAIVLLEINYRLSTQPESGSRMRLFWVGIDTATPWPWAIAGILAVGGFYAFRQTWRVVAAAWQRAIEEAGLDRGTGDAR